MRIAGLEDLVDSDTEHTVERFTAKVLDQDPDELMLDEAAAQFLKIAPKTLASWRFNGGGPKFVRLSRRCVRYRKKDLVTWIEARIKSSTSDL